MSIKRSIVNYLFGCWKMQCFHHLFDSPDRILSVSMFLRQKKVVLTHLFGNHESEEDCKLHYIWPPLTWRWCRGTGTSHGGEHRPRHRLTLTCCVLLDIQSPPVIQCVMIHLYKWWLIGTFLTWLEDVSGNKKYNGCYVMTISKLNNEKDNVVKDIMSIKFCQDPHTYLECLTSWGCFLPNFLYSETSCK